jgi:hypothetical protein
MFRTTAAAFVLVFASSLPAAAADATAGATAAASSREAQPMSGADIDWTLPAVHFGAPEAARGTLLPVLYVGLAGLNVFDAVSTSVGLSRGGTEANPLMRGVAGTPVAMWAVKGGITAATIYTAERLWRNDRKAQAILVMVASNVMMATVAARNVRVLQQQR